MCSQLSDLRSIIQHWRDNETAHNFTILIDLDYFFIYCVVFAKLSDSFQSQRLKNFPERMSWLFWTTFCARPAAGFKLSSLFLFFSFFSKSTFIYPEIAYVRWLHCLLEEVYILVRSIVLYMEWVYGHMSDKWMINMSDAR